MADEAHGSIAAKRKMLRLIFVILVSLTLFPFAYSFFSPWTRICCTTDEINIRTGQARYSRYYWFVRCSREVRSTPLSVALEGTVSSDNENDWVTVNTLSPGQNHSPHHRFHGALSQAHKFEQIAAMEGWSTERKKEVAARVLELWQTNSGYQTAEAFLNNLISTEHPNTQRP